MNRIVINIPLEPTGQMRPRRGKVVRGKNGQFFAPVHKAGKQSLREHKLIGFIVPKAPRVPWKGPVSLTVIAVHERPAHWPKWKQTTCGIYPTCTPDLDNVVKQIKDCMSEIIFEDDKQIVRLLACQEYGPKSQWLIEVEELPGYRHDIKRIDLKDDRFG
jgi:Holliday junction resolvase RusA-like endonuclease